MDRNEAIKRIRAGLKARRQPGDPIWSVKGGTGTAWGWIKVNAPPSVRTWSHRLQAGAPDEPGRYVQVDTGEPGHDPSPALCARLSELLNLKQIRHQGVSIPASTGHYVEYVARAEGRTPETFGVQYWD